MRVLENSILQRGLRIVINWPLYEKLLYGTLGRAGKRELTVQTFDDLPPDGTTGIYNPKTNTVYVDIGEIGILSLLRGKTRQQVDDEVTNVLAHEGKHFVQHERLGYIKDIDRMLLLGATFILSAALVFCAYFVWSHAVEFLFLKVFGMSSASRLSAILVSIITWIVLVRYCSWIMHLVFFLLKHAAYRLSWCERDARKYAKGATTDPSWADVVQVEKEPSIEDALDEARRVQ